MSAAVHRKAFEYLCRGQVRVQSVAPDSAVAVRAQVKGSADEPYVVTQVRGRWSCTCPATVPVCAHVLAVALVTVDAATVRQQMDSPDRPAQ